MVDKGCPIAKIADAHYRMRYQDLTPTQASTHANDSPAITNAPINVEKTLPCTGGRSTNSDVTQVKLDGVKEALKASGNCMYHARYIQFPEARYSPVRLRAPE